jgi:hypothetical protein
MFILMNEAGVRHLQKQEAINHFIKRNKRESQG